jgi:hypothetical protein
MVNSIITNDVDTTCAICGPNVMLQDHLQHLIPRCSMGNDESGTRLLHTISDSQCLHPGCDNSSILNHIQTSWPNILHILPETIMSGENSFNMEPLIIPHQFGIQNDIKYELVGHIHYNRDAQHFTCNCIIAGCLYKSDDV